MLASLHQSFPQTPTKCVQPLESAIGHCEPLYLYSPWRPWANHFRNLSMILKSLGSLRAWLGEQQEDLLSGFEVQTLDLPALKYGTFSFQSLTQSCDSLGIGTVGATPLPMHHDSSFSGTCGNFVKEGNPTRSLLPSDHWWTWIIELRKTDLIMTVQIFKLIWKFTLHHTRATCASNFDVSPSSKIWGRSQCRIFREQLQW